MSKYNAPFKSKIVQRMMGPDARSASSLSQELGIPQPTLSLWLRAARATMEPMSKKRADSPHTPAPRRAVDWSAEERFRVLAEAAKLSDDELGALLRREGLHEATLQEWRAAALEGLGSERTTRAQQKRNVEQKRVKELERELRRKEKALAEAAALLVLQKKSARSGGTRTRAWIRRATSDSRARRRGGVERCAGGARV